MGRWAEWLRDVEPAPAADKTDKTDETPLMGAGSPGFVSFVSDSVRPAPAPEALPDGDETLTTHAELNARWELLDQRIREAVDRGEMPTPLLRRCMALGHRLATMEANAWRMDR